ncbi:MAG: hypothetical protein ACREHD_30325, partial [Pirellulales bacterium]
MTEDRSAKHSVSRRQILATAAAGAAALSVQGSARAEGPVATKGDIKQSLVQWCYKKYWDIDEMCRVAKQLGCVSIELADPKDW